LHSTVKLRGWNSIERDMRMAGYTEKQIEEARESFHNGIMLLIRIFGVSAPGNKQVKLVQHDHENPLYKTV